MSRKEIHETLRRYPRIVAHMICESLGYFPPDRAANAIIYYKEDVPFFCELYVDIASKRDDIKGDRDTKVKEAGRRFLRQAIKRRHEHEGFMSDYQQARAVIQRELEGKGPKFASWF